MRLSIKTVILFWTQYYAWIEFAMLGHYLISLFVCLAPVVGFGGLFSTATKGTIGTKEKRFNSSIGVINALLVPQSLKIILGNSPFWAFVSCLVQMDKVMEVLFTILCLDGDLQNQHSPLLVGNNISNASG